MIIDWLNVFYISLNELGISVSIGFVVDFCLKFDFRENIESGVVFLIYFVYLNGVVDWLKKFKKFNVINVFECLCLWFWSN